MNPSSHSEFMREAIRLAREGMLAGQGGPFGAVVVKDGQIIGRGNNRVLLTNDPTTHAEIVAIREACKTLGNYQLTACDIYTSCEPCPMCLGAIYWARPERLFYACTRQDAAEIGFDDAFIYNELNVLLPNRKIPSQQLLREEGITVFELWKGFDGRKIY